MTLSPSRPLRDFFGSLANLVGAGCHPSRRPDPPFNRTRVCRDLKAREGMGTPEPAFLCSLFRKDVALGRRGRFGVRCSPVVYQRHLVPREREKAGSEPSLTGDRHGSDDRDRRRAAVALSVGLDPLDAAWPVVLFFGDVSGFGAFLRAGRCAR